MAKTCDFISYQASAEQRTCKVFAAGLISWISNVTFPRRLLPTALPSSSSLRIEPIFPQQRLVPALLSATSTQRPGAGAPTRAQRGPHLLYPDECAQAPHPPAGLGWQAPGPAFQGGAGQPVREYSCPRKALTVTEIHLSPLTSLFQWM